MKIGEVSLKPEPDPNDPKPTSLRIVPIHHVEDSDFPASTTFPLRAINPCWNRGIDPDFHLGHVGAE